MVSRDEMPEDYRVLLADSGPGTLAGVLRLLAPGGPGGFDMRAEERHHRRPHSDARLWGVFSSGETCWWLPIRDDPRHWLVVVAGNGQQQLNISTTEFLRRWAGGRLDLPVLSLPPAPRSWTVTPAGDPVVAGDAAPARRDPLAQLATIIGPGSPQAYDWPAVERGLGRPLPADYKRLHEAYGSPFTQNGLSVSAPDDLLSTQTMLADTLEDMCEDAGSGYRVHPAPGGLLLCLSTESRGLLCWDTRDPDPGAWPVVYLDEEEEVFPGTLTELLVAEMTGTGPDLADFGLGDPGEWAWPFWGPDEPWW